MRVAIFICSILFVVAGAAALPASDAAEAHDAPVHAIDAYGR